MGANLLEEAIEHHKQGRVQDAQDIYNEILKNDPNNAEALYLSSVAFFSEGDFANAYNHSQKALTLSDSVDLLKLAGDICLSIGKLDEAKGNYEKALNKEPTNPNILFSLGMLYNQQNKKDEAMDYFQKTISVEPYDADAYYFLGEILLDKNDIENAIKCFLNTIHINKDHAGAQYQLGSIYHRAGQLDTAVQYLETAIKLNPKDPVTLNTLGSIYMVQNKLEKSIETYKKGLEVLPGSAGIMYNLGYVSLLAKKFDEGWELFEARIHSMPEHRLKYDTKSVPKYDGSQDIRGKTIYVYCFSPTYAFGDSIMLSRFIPSLIERGAKVKFKPQKALFPLFEENSLGAEIVRPDVPDESIKPDFQLPMMSLAHPFKPEEDSIPLKNAYIKANPEKTQLFKEKFFNIDKFKVGLAWKSTDTNNRTTQIENFEEFFRLDGAQFYSFTVQKAEVENLKKFDKNCKVIDLSGELADFSDTAAAMANLDLFVTVDTSVAHLAGAMGIKTFLLLPFSPNWRWFLGSNKTAWYNSVTLFRQKGYMRWDKVIEDLYNEVKAAMQ